MKKQTLKLQRRWMGGLLLEAALVEGVDARRLGQRLRPRRRRQHWYRLRPARFLLWPANDFARKIGIPTLIKYLNN